MNQPPVPARPKGTGRRQRVVVFAAFSAALLAPIAQAPAHAAVSAVSGGAFGFRTDVSLFGGPTNTRGTSAADAVVELPAAGSTTPMADYAVSGIGRYGPAVIFQSGPLVVSTHGDKGDALRPALVASTATVADIGPWHSVMLEDNSPVPFTTPVDPGQMDPFIAAKVTSSCTATENGNATGTTTIAGGRLVDTDANGNATNVRQVPVNPAPNTTDQGTLAHIGDSWRITYNEQIVTNGGKTIQVSAVHLELLGPTAVGHMYIGQSRCGL